MVQQSKDLLNNLYSKASFNEGWPAEQTHANVKILKEYKEQANLEANPKKNSLNTQGKLKKSK